ncbi:hypothetical protein [Nocardia concava]|uniref:hypothetical protein n=1 Tax=Nocardia concava TaxID=257281 RepID=UPI0002EBE229|nr:hypothetical protein [Nocardia concava]
MNPETPPAQSRSLIAIAVAAVAVLIAAAAVVVALTREGSHRSEPSTSMPATSAPAAAIPSAGPSSTAAPSASQTSIAPAEFGYQPLWPFGSVSEAVAWQRSADPGGHQPWHLSEASIAQMFTQQYLGFTAVNKVVKVRTQGEESWVSVGFDNPNGAATVAAVVHLVRIGEGTANDKPWEVVGTQDTTLTVSTPAYGATVRSPITVGGTITGVDESLHIQLGALGQDHPVGNVTGIPAGGNAAPWTASVPFTLTCPATLTIAVSTGGHIAEVERFAVTGARC